MDVGKYLIFTGSFIFAIGFLIYYNKLSWFGNLIGDFKFSGKNYKVYFPFSSMILVSIFLSLVIKFYHKMFK